MSVTEEEKLFRLLRSEMKKQGYKIVLTEKGNRHYFTKGGKKWLLTIEEGKTVIKPLQ